MMIQNIPSRLYIVVILLTIIFSCSQKKHASIHESPYVEILFLGHDSEHHNSEKYLPVLASALISQEIRFTYTSDLNDLNPENLAKYDGLAIYANHDSISNSQEKALLDFVKSGKGMIPIHCASNCFQNSDTYISMVGGQFESHDTATFKGKFTQKGKEMLSGLSEFETWDETYVHHKINPDIELWIERVDGSHIEPWTWTNTYGKGRVFYTAYGHDERTWYNPEFQKLMAQGILWSVGDEIAKKVADYKFPSLTYTPAIIPNYEKRNPPLKLQAALSPEESMEMTQVPVGFELELFASEPDIINPIAMNWDEKGRLWVIETVDYPNTVRNEDGVGDDRIKICEDTDHDGKADKFTVFAENLNIPTSLVFSNGGIIVSQAPHFLFLKDTDGDDKADVREVMITGWGTFDTHAGPSNLQYGFDNKIWGTVGYSGYAGVVDGIPITFKQGIFRFDPNGTGLEQLTKTSNNTWGLGFSENFDVFASTANNTHSVFMGIPNAYLQDVRDLPDNGSKKIDGHYAFHPITQEVRQVDVFGGFTAAAGHHLYTARNFPKEYWNRIAFVCEPTGRLIHRAILEEDGAGFKEQDGWNLVASHDNWFGPVQAEVGPDGAVWFADWYNFIIQHNPTPPGFENGPGNAHINPLRDRQHGRIYRLVYKGAKHYEPISLSKEDPQGLIHALKNDNLFWRMHAQRLLIERGSNDVVPELLAIIRDGSVDEIGINPAAIHALWVLDGLGIIQKEMDRNLVKTIVGALNHSSAGVRKAAVQVLPKTTWATYGILESGMLYDPDKHTQLAAILAISKMPASERVGNEMYNLSLRKDVESDTWLSQAVYIAATKHQEGFTEAIFANQPALLSNEQKSSKNPWDSSLDISDWGSVEVPGLWEGTEIGDVDGVIWFRKEINLPKSMDGQVANLSLGPIDDSDETWVNGIKVGGIEGKFDAFRSYIIPTGVLKTGTNTIAVKVTDTGGGGGFWGKPGEMGLMVGDNIFPLAGQWRYQIEQVKGGQTKPVFNKQNSIARVFLKNYSAGIKKSVDRSADESWPADAKVIVIKPIVNEMKYDLKSFEVEAGQAVEIRFENIDFMQHNLLILATGSLEKVGAAADAMASQPDGASKNYTPEMPEVLYATPLVDPNSEAVLRFIAPDKPGDYPFVCTFPGHWRMMNGVMKVTGKTI